MIKFYSLFLLCICTEFCVAQGPLAKQWDKRYGGSDFDALRDFQQTNDGGYILGGSSRSPISGDKTTGPVGDYDYWLVKTDWQGNKQWDKVYGGTDVDQLYAVQQTSDGGYIMSGYSSSGIGADKTDSCRGASDYWIVKTDWLGNKEWDKTFGGTGIEYSFDVQQTPDGGYIIGGYSHSLAGADKTDSSYGSSDYWIIKTDGLGNKQWDKAFGGLNVDRFTALDVTKDGGCILGGYSSSPPNVHKTDSSRGQYDFWIVKLSVSGVKQWDKTYGGTENDHLWCVKQSPDGGYLMGGLSKSAVGGDKTQGTKGLYDYWVVKADSLGNKQWDKDFGTVGDEDDFGNVWMTMDGGYLLAGTSYDDINGDKTEANLGVENAWLVKIDSLGNKQWDKTILTNGHDEAGYAAQTTDGCYVVANHTAAPVGGYKTFAGQGSQDYWIVKFCDTTMVTLPSAHFISSDTAFCEESGKCIDFTDFSTGNVTSWKWLFPGATPSFSNQQNPVNICYYTPGTYPVTLIVSNTAGTDTLTVMPMIVFGSAPAKPVVTQGGGDTLFSSHGSQYQWYFNGSPIPFATDSFYVPTAVGAYAVMVTKDLGCSSLSDGVLYTSVIEISAEGISVYPNPVGREFAVISSKFVENAVLELYNALGEKIYSSPFYGTQTIDLDLKAGLYYILLTDGSRQLRERIIKN